MEQKTAEQLDREVEEALHRRACGYEAEDTVCEENEKGVRVRTTRYHIPGDVRAMIFWLKNRRPKIWRDKQDADDSEEGEKKGVSIIDDIA